MIETVSSRGAENDDGGATTTEVLPMAKLDTESRLNLYGCQSEISDELSESVYKTARLNQPLNTGDHRACEASSWLDLLSPVGLTSAKKIAE
ncbi:hypothetical protein L7F22_012692 [Adiantum nelumboides]|nr:hypothetical protein [Adiantum nelumboides]